jgi:hypothetical protein
MTRKQPDSQSCGAAFQRRDGGRHPNPRARVPVLACSEVSRPGRLFVL